MQSSGQFVYPAIPASDQDIPPYVKSNTKSFTIRRVPGTLAPGMVALDAFFIGNPMGGTSPEDAFRAESITHVKKENEQYVRTYHPSLASQDEVWVSESVFGETVWLVCSPLAPSHSVYAGGRPIHYYPGDSFLIGYSGLTTPPSWHRYMRTFDREINPRRFLTPADLDSLRELFPEAVGVSVLIAGFMIILFEEKRHVHDAFKDTRYPMIGGLFVVFHLVHYSFTTAPVESGNVLKEAFRKKEDTSAGCLGLKLKLQNGSTAITTVTHGFVPHSNPSPSRFDKGLRVFEMIVDQMKQTMRRALTSKAREHDRALVMAKGTLTNNNPVGKQVSLVGSNRSIGTVTHTYDAPSNDNPYPAGYSHDLCLITGPSLPDVVSPPGFPPVTGWGSCLRALEGQDCYVVAQNTSTGGKRVIQGPGAIDQTLFRRAVLLGTGYTWDKITKKSNAFLLWHTMSEKGPADRFSGAPLCLGHPSDTAAQAVAFQNFQQGCTLSCIEGKLFTKGCKLKTFKTFINAGFVLPQEIKDSTILGGETPNSTSLFNALPAKN